MLGFDSSVVGQTTHVRYDMLRTKARERDGICLQILLLLLVG